MNMPTHIVAVAGLVKDNHGNVLIGWSNWRKQWEFFGGQVENGENLAEALLREIKEETGITAKVTSLAGIYSNTKGRIEENGVIIPTKLMLSANMLAARQETLMKRQMYNGFPSRRLLN